MFTLALDTSTNRGGIAILKDRDSLSTRVWEREKSHSELLTSLIDECVNEAKIKLKDINQIAVGKGPGSFTGIRIAINAAKTLAYSLNVPVYAFDTTEILAAAVTPQKTPLLALVNAHKNLLYTSIFEPKNGTWTKVSGPEAWTLEEIEKAVTTQHLCVGDAYLEFKEVLPDSLAKLLERSHHHPDHPSAEVLGRLAFDSTSSPLVWKEVQALYIRASEAEEKYREGLKKQTT